MQQMSDDYIRAKRKTHDKHGRREDFFPELATGGFSKVFPRGFKSGKICFFPLKTKKTIFLLNISKTRWAQAPLAPLVTPIRQGVWPVVH